MIISRLSAAYGEACIISSNTVVFGGCWEIVSAGLLKMVALVNWVAGMEAVLHGLIND